MEPSSSSPRAVGYLSLAYLCTGLGVIGAFLPLLPTTPFLLVAAWAAQKGSPRLHQWLYAHPRFGEPLRAWDEQGAISVRGKWLACSLMWLSWLIMFNMTEGLLVPALTGVLFVVICAYLITRPTPVQSP